MNDKDEVMLVMREHFAARLDGDAETALDAYAEDWSDSKGYSKSSMRKDHLIFDYGPDKTEIDLDLGSVEILVEKDRATFGPVIIFSPKGSITYAYRLRKKADGRWLITFTQTVDWELGSVDKETTERKRELDGIAAVIRQHRESLLQDPLRPGYHFVVPEGVAFPFDPNGAIYWKGRYHLFYIFQDKRGGHKSDHWGHVSSTDLFHWRHHPTGLIDGMFSGNCFLNENGVPTICYHQVDKGNSLAVSQDDDLNEWEKLESNPITPETNVGDQHHGKYRSWDPFGWYERGTYYAIFGGENPAIAKSSDINGPWEYVGDFFAQGLEGVESNEDVSCADFFMLGDKHVLLCISHQLGCRYYVGTWKNEQFYPESHSRMSWVDNSFFAPESLVDESGRRIMWAWLLDAPGLGFNFKNGWSGTLALPRVLTLNSKGELMLDVPDEIKALRYRPLKLSNFEVERDSEIEIGNLKSNSLELSILMEGSDAFEYGVKVCVSPDRTEETVLSYRNNEGILCVDATKSGPEHLAGDIEKAPFMLDSNEALNLRVFVDKSVVEIFANGRQAISRRIYPSRSDSLGVSIFSRGGPLLVGSFESWEISPSNPY